MLLGVAAEKAIQNKQYEVKYIFGSSVNIPQPDQCLWKSNCSLFAIYFYLYPNKGNFDFYFCLLGKKKIVKSVKNPI